MEKTIFEHVPCNLCGSDDPDIILKSKRTGASRIETREFRSSGDEILQDQLVKCRACGLLYVTPRLKSSLVLEGYVHAVDETFVLQAKGREKTFKRCLDTIQQEWGRQPGRMLDVGTANGSFLKVAKDAGWDVAGCEPNLWMTEWCRKNYGITVTAGTLFDGHYRDEEFDIITFWDVLEHTADPMKNLQECMRILRPGGLLVLNYPDIGAWISRLMASKWVFLLSVHYYYFNRKTIRTALEKVGLSVMKIKPHFQTLEMDYILFRSEPYIAGIAKFLRSSVKALRLEKALIPYWIGQSLVISAKPETERL